MKVRYRFVDGNVEIEVSEDIYDALMTLERLEYNNEHKETRRHVSLDRLIEEQGMQFRDERIDTMDRALEQLNLERLNDAMEELLPKQRMLLSQVFYEGRTISSIARAEGVSHVAILGRLARIYKQLKILLE